MTYVFWRIQSKVVLYAYYRVVLPVLRENRLIYWVWGGTAVVSHELLGHMLVGITTGSDAKIAAQFTPEKGQVRIIHRQSAWGFLSAVLATIAPCFAPSALLLLAFSFFYPISFEVYDAQTLVLQTLTNFISILNVVFNSDLTNPPTLLFIYFLSTVSMTAGASKADFQIITSHILKYWYFTFSMLLVSSIGLEVLRAFFGLSSVLQLLLPLASFLFLSFLLIILGITISLYFAAYLKFVKNLPIYLKFIAFAAFPATYITVLYSPFYSPLPPYFSILMLSLFILIVWTTFLKLAFNSLNSRRTKTKPIKRIKIESLRKYEMEE